jgi:magnesium-transporting ATPase (P-type)
MIYQMANNWANLIAAIIAIITFIVTFLIPKGQKSSRKGKMSDSPKIFKIVRLIQSSAQSTWELSRNGSIFANIIILSYAVALVVGAIGALLVDNNNLFNIKMIVILLILFILPISSLIEDFGAELKLRTGQKSSVFRWAEIEVIADYDSLLTRSFQVLSDMGAHITHYNQVVGVLEAEIQRSDIVLEIRMLQNGHYTVYISSDSKKITTAIDFGRNQKYVNECATRLLGYR